jgi:gas vesicle protein
VIFPNPAGDLPPNPTRFADITEFGRGESAAIGRKCRVRQLARRQQKSGQTEVKAKTGRHFRNRKNQQHTCMKLSKLICLSACALLLGTATRLTADDNARPRGEKPERSQNGRPGRIGDVPNLGIPSKLVLPEDLQKLVDQFKAQAQTFVSSQKEIAQQLKGATAEQKETLKEQLKTNREKFLEDTKQLRADIRERVKELKATLQETRPVDAGAGEGRGKGRRGGN